MPASNATSADTLQPSNSILGNTMLRWQFFLTNHAPITMARRLLGNQGQGGLYCTTAYLNCQNSPFNENAGEKAWNGLVISDRSLLQML